MGRLTSKLAGAMRKQPSPPPTLVAGSQMAAQEPAPPPPARQQPADPRGALLSHGVVPLLVRLVINSSAAVAAAGRATSQAAAAAAAAAAVQRAALPAALQALNNMCADPTAAAVMRAWARGTPEVQQQLSAALTAAMGDRQLGATCRDHARFLLRSLSGAPGQWHANVCSCPAPPLQAPAFPTP